MVCGCAKVKVRGKKQSVHGFLPHRDFQSHTADHPSAWKTPLTHTHWERCVHTHTHWDVHKHTLIHIHTPAHKLVHICILICHKNIGKHTHTHTVRQCLSPTAAFSSSPQTLSLASCQLLSITSNLWWSETRVCVCACEGGRTHVKHEFPYELRLQCFPQRMLRFWLYIAELSRPASATTAEQTLYSFSSHSLLFAHCCHQHRFHLILFNDRTSA